MTANGGKQSVRDVIRARNRSSEEHGGAGLGGDRWSRRGEGVC